MLHRRPTDSSLKSRWHRYYCGEEHNPNRFTLGRGLVGWAISRERVDMIRRDVERWQSKAVQS